MTTYSQSDLATRVLRDLGVIDANETPEASDLSNAVEIIASETAQMAARGIRIWNGSDESVPLEYLTALSRRLALAVGPSHGVFTIMDAAAGIEPAERVLRQIGAKLPTGSVAEAEYF